MKTLIKILSLNLLTLILFAGAQAVAATQVSEGARVDIHYGQNSDYKGTLSYQPETFGGINVSPDMDIGPGYELRIGNVNFDSKKKIIKIRKKDDSTFTIYLDHNDKTTDKSCKTVGDECKPGIACGEGPGPYEICTYQGVTMYIYDAEGKPKGNYFQEGMGFVQEGQTIEIKETLSSANIRTSEGMDFTEIANGESVDIELDAGEYLTFKIQEPKHSKMDGQDRLLFHMEKEVDGTIPGSTKIVGTLNFEAKFDPSDDNGDLQHEVEVKAGDVISIKGAEDGKDFSYTAKTANYTSMLKVYSKAGADLRAIKINDGKWVTLNEGTHVTLSSFLGKTGWRDDSADKEYALADNAARTFTQKGDILAIRTFSTKKPDGGIGKIGQVPDGPKIPGPSDWAAPTGGDGDGDGDGDGEGGEEPAPEDPSDGGPFKDAGFEGNEKLTPTVGGSGSTCSLMIPAANSPLDLGIALLMAALMFKLFSFKTKRQ